MFSIRTATAIAGSCALRLISNVASCHQLSDSNKNNGCASPVCSDMLSNFMKSTQQLSGKASAMSSSGSVPLTPINDTLLAQGDCPLDKNELGRATWSLLHTMAIYYPDHPSEDEQRAAKEFAYALSVLYPCPQCREDYKDTIGRFPPRVDSRESFSKWACELHNEVNRKLNKPEVSCDLNSLDMRWRLGHKQCWTAQFANEDDSFVAVSVEKTEDE